MVKAARPVGRTLPGATPPHSPGAAVDADERFRAALETMMDPFVILVPRRDAAGTVVDFVYEFANQAACRYNRVSADELIGKRLLELFPEHAAAGLLDQYRSVLETGTPLVIDDLSYEDVWGGERARRVFDVRATRLDDGILYTWRDVTDRRAAAESERTRRSELERLVEERTAELVAANRELEAFGYSVSHDLRAPLRSIAGFSEAIIEDYADRLDDEGRRDLERVKEGVVRMNELIDAMLTLSRVTRAEMHVEDVDVAALARSALADLHEAEPGRSVTTAVPEHLPARGDRRLLAAAVANLVGNAWKFTARVVEPRIEVGRADTDRGPAFFVRDNGVGFDMAYAERLFGAFQRFHPSREYAGLGIGLATVQRIVGRHGGRTWAESAPDRGATFYFQLGAGMGGEPSAGAAAPAGSLGPDAAPSTGSA